MVLVNLINEKQQITHMTWQEKNDTLTKTFIFGNFVQAIAFVNKVGLLAEEHNHHPDINLHNYKKVTITLTTHEKENTITKKDYALAELIDKENI